MWISVLAVMLAVELPAPIQDPPPPEPPPLGLILGTATAVAPLIAGGVLMAHDDSPHLQRTGLIVMVSGFAAAPWVAHGVEGSWRNAALYGGISLALSAGTVAAMETSNAFDPHVGNRARIPMKILLPLAMGSSVLGVVMSTFDRRGDGLARLSLWAAPRDGGLAAGLGWSGRL